MSAIEWRECRLLCDAPDCRADFWTGSDIARAELRKRAGKAGWTHVRGHSGPRRDDDFCPAHKPEPKAGAQ